MYICIHIIYKYVYIYIYIYICMKYVFPDVRNKEHILGVRDKGHIPGVRNKTVAKLHLRALRHCAAAP